MTVGDFERCRRLPRQVSQYAFRPDSFRAPLGLQARDDRFNALPGEAARDRRPKRFDLVYTLHSIPHGHRFSLVIALAEGEPAPSASELWKTADWQERECYDMFGIVFDGHPDLRRILLPEWWQGWPLRKDYPTTGRGEHERVVEEALRPIDAD